MKSEEGKPGNANLPIGGFRASQETGEPGVRRSAKEKWPVGEDNNYELEITNRHKKL